MVEESFKTLAVKELVVGDVSSVANPKTGHIGISGTHLVVYVNSTWNELV